jgi:hypothetical protein
MLPIRRISQTLYITTLIYRWSNRASAILDACGRAQVHSARTIFLSTSTWASKNDRGSSQKLNPQAEPDCEFKTDDPKADERRKLVAPIRNARLVDLITAVSMFKRGTAPGTDLQSPEAGSQSYTVPPSAGGGDWTPSI